MTYAYVENQEISKIGLRPRWTDAEGNPVPDDVLRAGGYATDEDGEIVRDGNDEPILATDQPGWFPVIDEPPAYDPITQWIERRPFGEWTIHADAVYATYVVHERDPAEVAAALVREIDAERDRRIAAGFVFGGKFYQSRPDDRENIAGASVAALAAIGNGALPGDYRWHGGETDFTWIAADNSLTLMDAQTMFAFGQAAMAHKQAHIFAARALKDADPIPTDYTDDIHWPATGE